MTSPIRAGPGRRSSDQLLQKAEAIAHLGSWLLELADLADLNRNSLHWSDECYRIFGYEPRAFPASNEAFFKAVHPDDIAKIQAAVSRALSDGTEYRIEHRVVRPDGAVRVVEERASIEYDDDRRPLRLVGTVLDITELRQAEDLVRMTGEHSRLLASVVSGSADAITTANSDRVITSWNPAAERLFGWKAEEMIGKPFTLFVPEDQREQSAQVHARVRRGEFGPPVETVRLHKDGTRIDVRITASPILDESGRVVGGSAILRDIRDQKRLAAQLQLSQRLESVGRLAGGVAHDFNNLLTAITGYGELALMELGAESPAAQDLQSLLKACERASDLTRQLLAFGRRQVLTPVPLDVNGVLRELDGILHRLTGDDLTLTMHLCAMPARISFDRAQLEQVVVNLVTNARDAVRGNGRVEIATELASLHDARELPHPSAPAGDWVRITVTDDGEGIPHDALPHIFEPFFSTKPQGKGSGMGLATVYGIVQQSGGFITVDSAPGRGTTFRVFLRRREDAITAAPEPAPVSGPLRGSETILLVEDEPGVLTATSGLLRRYGYRVLAASTPADAERIARSEPDPIHVLLTDAQMPQMRGPDLARRIIAVRDGLKVVCMSGYPADAMPTRAGSSPEIAYLQKPFSADALARRLREVLDG